MHVHTLFQSVCMRSVYSHMQAHVWTQAHLHGKNMCFYLSILARTLNQVILTPNLTIILVNFNLAAVFVGLANSLYQAGRFAADRWARPPYWTSTHGNTQTINNQDYIK